MDEFVEVATEFPTVLFTVALVGSFLFFALTSLLGFGAEGFDIDAELGGDGLFSNLGLAGIPVALTATLVSLFSWFASFLAMTLIGDRWSSLVIIIGIVVIVLSIVVGTIAASIVSQPVGRVFAAGAGRKRGDLAGQLCTITTLKVTDVFGQAEVTDPAGGSLLIQVRCAADNELTSGDQALIFGHDTDADTYMVSSDTDDIGA